MDQKVFIEQIFTELPSNISRSNFFDCEFRNCGSNTTFDRCNLQGCVYGEPTTFAYTNVLHYEDQTIPEGCVFDHSNYFEVDKEGNPID